MDGVDGGEGQWTGSAPIAIDVVVEGELLMLLDIPLGEDAHAHPVADRPLRDIAVGGA